MKTTTSTRMEQQQPRTRHTGCSHLGMRAVTVEEEPRLDERKRQPFTCDDCSSPALGPTRFTLAYVMNLLLAERRSAVPA